MKMTEKQKVLMEVWLQRIRECRNSGMTVKQWCELNQINENTYFYWLKKARWMSYPEAAGKRLLPAESKNEFVELAVSHETSIISIDNPPSEAVVPSVVSDMQTVAKLHKNGVTLDICNDISDSILSRLLEVMFHAEARN